MRWNNIPVYFWKRCLAVMIIVFLTGISGCAHAVRSQDQRTESEESTAGLSEEEEEMIRIYCELYSSAEERDAPFDLEVIRDIVEQMGEYGYTAVDSRNQIDMTEAEKAVQFCEEAGKKKSSELTVIEVIWSGGLMKYDMEAEDGKINVSRTYYEYADGSMKKASEDRYPVKQWQYTEEGYFMFSGILPSDMLYVKAGVEEEYTAFRVQPLDEKCRELNRKYLLPIGYKCNNMFLADWDEEDFGELNFYDMFELLYPKVTGQQVPYMPADDAGIGKIYHISEKEFEGVIMEYFNIDSSTLQSKTVYYSNDKTYEFKPRGFWESECPAHPYPEVVKYTENENGTVTLFVNAVFPVEINSKTYAHEVVVRPMDDGSMQYVSNRRIPSESDYEITWYVPRLSGDEWDEVYR